uniref:Ig-like domain-containing protein n=1 Tax=Neolamprologus brichardi TaxID=32507 RepID=A0A3Q4I1G6_NEOBR
MFKQQVSGLGNWIFTDFPLILWIFHLSSATVQLGASLTLNCTVHTGTCDEEHSVYWFKSSEKSHPGLIYTHEGRNNRCESKTNTQTDTCVYNLPIKSLNLSDNGMYYCAVASCGHILFGNGTKLGLEVFTHSAFNGNILTTLMLMDVCIHAQHYYYFKLMNTQRLFVVFKGPDSRRPQSTYKHHPGLTNFGTPRTPYKSMEQQKLFIFINMPKNACFLKKYF